MSRREKLIKRLLLRPKDFTVDEMNTLLGYFGYTQDCKGKTSGSRIIFSHPKYKPIQMHKPHPHNTINPVYINEIVSVLKREGLI